MEHSNGNHRFNSFSNNRTRVTILNESSVQTVSLRQQRRKEPLPQRHERIFENNNVDLSRLPTRSKISQDLQQLTMLSNDESKLRTLLATIQDYMRDCFPVLFLPLFLLFY